MPEWLVFTLVGCWYAAAWAVIRYVLMPKAIHDATEAGFAWLISPLVAAAVVLVLVFCWPVAYAVGWLFRKKGD